MAANGAMRAMPTKTCPTGGRDPLAAIDTSLIEGVKKEVLTLPGHSVRIQLLYW
jgi:hypothetical protein